MLRQHHEATLEGSIAETFSSLLAVLARGRWDGAWSGGWGRSGSTSGDWASGGSGGGALGEAPPIGLRYTQQRRSVLRSGRVVECIRPVALTLQETLHDPPCRVELKLRWRLVPEDAGVRLLLDACFDLRGAAAFRRRHWKGRIRAHCTRMITAVEAAVAAPVATAASVDDQSSVSGQNTGSSSIAVMNVTSVNGTPTFRK